MRAPQIILVTITAVSLLISAREHGKQHESPKNFWMILISDILVYALLIWGGFFK